jgi:hypothetical protein
VHEDHHFLSGQDYLLIEFGIGSLDRAEVYPGSETTATRIRPVPDGYV